MKIYFYTLPINEKYYAIYAAHGLERLGHEIIKLPKVEHEGNLVLDQRKLNSPTWVKTQNADLIMYHGFSFMNTLKHQALNYFFPEEADIPYVVMWYDNPERYLYWLDKIKHTNHLFFCCDSVIARRMADRGYSCLYSPCMADSTINRPLQDDNSQYTHNVVFAGSVISINSILGNLKGLDFREIQALEKINDKREPGKFIDYGLELEEKGTRQFSDLSFFNLMTQKHYLRMELFDVAKKYDLHIYGKGNWKTDAPGITLHGYADQHRELPKIYSNAKINLTVEALPASVHQRIYEAAACKGFILCEDKADMAMNFESAIIWKNLKELDDKLKFYLDNDSERYRVSNRMYEEFKDKHDCHIRMKDVMHKVINYFD